MPDLSRLTAAARLPIERRTFPLRLWDGNPNTPAVYIATPHADRPGYALRRYEREASTRVVEGLLDGIQGLAEKLA